MWGFEQEGKKIDIWKNGENELIWLDKWLEICVIFFSKDGVEEVMRITSY
jgi:hypothetical protein